MMMLLIAAAALAALLLLNKKIKKRGKAGCLLALVRVLLVMTIVFSLCGALLPRLLFTDYQGLEPTGSYEVKEAAVIFVDDSRVESFETDGSMREVPVHLYYPDAPAALEGTLPLVVFSHGAFGYYQSNMSTYLELASHGYVVASLDHPYHAFFTTDTNGQTVIVDPQFISGVMQLQGSEETGDEGHEISQAWLTLRTGDMNLALDRLIAGAKDASLIAAWHTQQASELEDALSLVDPARIGVMGHSLGGAASVAIGRARTDIGAVIDIDGTMLGERMKLEDGTFENNREPYPVPLLAIDSQMHAQQIADSGESYVNGAVLDNAASSMHTYIKDSGHLNFTDLPLISPALASLLGTGSVDAETCIRTMNGVILAYFDSCLKGAGEADIRGSY